MNTAVRKIILVQIAVAALIALLMSVVLGKLAAISALTGGSIGFITALVYAKKMSTPQGAEAKKIVRAHYGAEAYKLAFTMLLFALVFKEFKAVEALPLFIGYVGTLVVYWAALIFV